MDKEEECIHEKLMNIIFEKGMNAIPEETNCYDVCDTLIGIIITIISVTDNPEKCLKEFINGFNIQIENFRSKL